MEKIVFNEVYDIIKCMNKKYQEKIPKNFMDFIGYNRDVFYTSKITSLPTNLNEVQSDTKVMLAIIYDRFIKNTELDIKIISDKDLSSNNNSDIMVKEFDKKENLQIINNNETKEIVVINNNSFFKKIIKKIKNFLNIKKK